MGAKIRMAIRTIEAIQAMGAVIVVAAAAYGVGYKQGHEDGRRQGVRYR
ncbi:MAG: hypothetical protein K0R00_45 [Herbinix sp.]|jgi:hypothetical protein|nr:hypothetical protein [Herbinix sp.]